MLKVFRDNLRRLAPVLWIVIAVFVLLVFADFQSTAPAAGSPDSAAATVAGRSITFAEFRRQYRNVEDRWRQIYGDAYTPELASQLGLPMQAMNDLVAQEILLLEAERMGLAATDEEIRETILGLPVFQTDRGAFVGEDQYRQILQQNRISVDDFESDIRQQVVLQKLNRVLARSAWIGDEELLTEARREAETATIRYLRLDAATLDEEPEVDDGALAAYFEENRESYRHPERRRLGYLAVNTNALRAEIEITDQELRDYYDQNSSEFTRQEQVRAQHILLFVNDERSADEARSELEAARARIEAGEDFAAVARQISEDEATRDRGGDLGYFPRGRMTPAFEEAAFSGEPGSLLGPIENQLGPRTGFHLIQVNDKQAGGAQPFEEVENQIRVRLLNERSRSAAETRARELHARLRDETISSEEDLRSLAEREGVSAEITDLIGVADNIPGIGRQTPLATTGFELQPGSVSEPIRIASGWALVTPLEVEPPRLPELDEVREQVRADAVADRKADLARQRLQEARERIDGGETLEQIAEDLGVEIETSSSFDGRGSIAGLTDSKPVVAAALQLEQGAIGGPIEVGNGAVLFEVSERQHFDPAAFADQKEQKREELRLARMNALLASLINQRRDQLDVTLSRDFLTNFELDGGPGAS